MDFTMQYETLKEHYLDPSVLGRTSVFYMRREPNSRMMSTLLIFSPENIIITGDLSPGRYGVISCIGYGIGWFGSRKDPYYLAEKFLDKCYESDRARTEANEYLKHLAEEAWACRDKGTIQEAKKLRNVIKEQDSWMFDDPYILRECLHDNELGYLCDDGVPFGWGYPTGDYCWLAAIQKRFSELYQEWLKTDEGKAFIDGKQNADSN